MIKHSKRISVMVAVTAVVLLAAACGDSTSTTIVGAAPASSQPATSAPIDQPLGAGPYPIADISLSVHPDGVDSTPTATYRITCQGDTANVSGDAPSVANDMCLALAAPEVHDLLTQGAPIGRICTEIYGGPNIATFAGTLDGANIDFTATRVNGCAISDWDSVLAQILP